MTLQQKRGSRVRHTIEEMHALAATRGGRCLSTQYVNGKTHLEWECAKGHRWRAMPDNVITRSSWCRTCANEKRPPSRLTIEDMQALAGAHGGRCLSTQYLGTHTPLEWECAQGHRWFTRPVKIKAGSWCLACAQDRQRSSIAELQQVAAERGGRCLSTQYVNTNTRLEWECAAGHRWFARPIRIKKGDWCRVCAQVRQRSQLAEFQQIAAERGGRCLSTEYVNNNTHLLWECAAGHQWRAVPSSVKGGTWCSLCATERLRVPLAEVQRAAAALGGRCLSTEYRNGTTALLFECAAGHRWEAAPVAVRQGHWCPRCAHDRRRLTIGQMRALAASRGGECLSEHYVDQRTHLRWRCAAGHEWESSPNAMRDHWCPQCRDDRRRLGIDLMHKLAAARGGQCLSQTYVNANHPLEWQCAQGHRWRAAPTRINSGNWCPTCDRGRRRLADMQALARSRGGECLSGAYVSTQHRLQWQCHRGHTWWTKPTHVQSGHWCPECAILQRCLSRKARRRYEAVALPQDGWISKSGIAVRDETGGESAQAGLGDVPFSGGRK